MHRASEFRAFTTISQNSINSCKVLKTGVLTLPPKHIISAVNRAPCFNMGTLALGDLGWVRSSTLQDRISGDLGEHCLQLGVAVPLVEGNAEVPRGSVFILACQGHCRAVSREGKTRDKVSPWVCQDLHEALRNLSRPVTHLKP